MEKFLSMTPAKHCVGRYKRPVSAPVTPEVMEKRRQQELQVQQELRRSSSFDYGLFPVPSTPSILSDEDNTVSSRSTLKRMKSAVGKFFKKNKLQKSISADFSPDNFTLALISRDPSYEDASAYGKYFLTATESQQDTATSASSPERELNYGRIEAMAFVNPNVDVEDDDASTISSGDPELGRFMPEMNLDQAREVIKETIGLIPTMKNMLLMRLNEQRREEKKTDETVERLKRTMKAKREAREEVDFQAVLTENGTYDLGEHSQKFERLLILKTLITFNWDNFENEDEESTSGAKHDRDEPEEAVNCQTDSARCAYRCFYP